MDKLSKICIHWSVTEYTPSPDCYEHYHFVLDGEGVVHNCKRPPESNLASSVQAGTYQAHCGGGNTDCIGVSLASMLGYVSPKNVGKYPITEKQVRGCITLVAQLCKKYGITITPDTVFTHYEFGLKHPKSTSSGKIDITYLPTHPQLKSKDIGNFFRSEVTKKLATLK